MAFVLLWILAGAIHAVAWTFFVPTWVRYLESENKNTFVVVTVVACNWIISIPFGLIGCLCAFVGTRNLMDVMKVKDEIDEAKKKAASAEDRAFARSMNND